MYELARLHDWKIVQENLHGLWDPLHQVWVHNSNVCLSHCTLIPWPSTWVPGPLWNGLTYFQLTPPLPLGTRIWEKKIQEFLTVGWWKFPVHFTCVIFNHMIHWSTKPVGFTPWGWRNAGKLCIYQFFWWWTTSGSDSHARGWTVSHGPWEAGPK